MQSDTIDFSDTIELLRHANPVATDPPVPPIEPLLALRDGEPSSPAATVDPRPRLRRRPRRPRTHGARRPRRLRALAGLSLAAAGLLLGVALLGGVSKRQFDVAAAVYRAIAPGPGVRYLVVDQESGAGSNRYYSHVERWSTSDPPRERVIWREQRGYGRERSWVGESSVRPGGASWSWSTARPGVIEQAQAGQTLKDTLSVIRAAYHSGRLRLVETTTLGARKVYRLQADLPRMKAAEGPEELLVDAKTFVPIEAIDYAREPHGHLQPFFEDFTRDPHGDLQPVFVLHYRTYEELPATPANLAKLNMAPHPGARVLTRR